MSYVGQILEGLNLTLGVFLLSLALSLPLGVIVAVLRLSKIKIISKITSIYIWVLRGTPLLLQIMVVFFGLPRLGLTLEGLIQLYLLLF